jgi:hypothetical protein
MGEKGEPFSASHEMEVKTLFPLNFAPDWL